eukprot:gene1319-2731_t
MTRQPQPTALQAPPYYPRAGASEGRRRGMVEDALEVAGSFPVIDISPLAGGSSGASAGVAAQIHAACVDSGFFYITGHGVSPDLVARLEALSREFFALPSSEKQKARHVSMARGGKAWRGWFRVGEEFTSGRPDMKEGYYFGSHTDPSAPQVAVPGPDAVWTRPPPVLYPCTPVPLYPCTLPHLYFTLALPCTLPLSGDSFAPLADLPLHGQNIWPDRPQGLRDAVEQYMVAVQAVGRLLLQGFSLALQLPRDYFENRFTRDPTTLFRIFAYPVHEWADSEEPDGLGALQPHPACSAPPSTCTGPN